MYRWSLLIQKEFDSTLVPKVQTKLNIPIPLKLFFHENCNYWKYFESAFNFYQSNGPVGGVLASEQLIQLKNLTVDLPTGAFLTTYLSPRYDLCITALCTCINQNFFQKDLQIEEIYPLFRALQWIHVSFFCFVIPPRTKPSINSDKTVFWVFKMMTRVLNKDANKKITLLKKYDLGIISHWLENLKLYEDLSVMKLYFSLHFQILISMINTKIQICDKKTFILSEWEEIYGIIHAFLLQTESLCYALARSLMLSKGIVHPKTNQPAYMVLFEKRNSIIKPPSFIEETELVCKKGNILPIVKQLLMSMFDVLSKVNWSDIPRVPPQENTLLKGSLFRERIKGIQSALLVMGDADISSKYRVVNLTEVTKDLVQQ